MFQSRLYSVLRAACCVTRFFTQYAVRFTAVDEWITQNRFMRNYICLAGVHKGCKNKTRSHLFDCAFCFFDQKKFNLATVHFLEKQMIYHEWHKFANETNVFELKNRIYLCYSGIRVIRD
jgi:GH43 family beta-xylosidase